jgi:plastocyanin
MYTIVAATAMLVTATVGAGPDKITFPADYQNGVLYATVDRYDTKQYRELYTSAEAVEAVKDGQPIPSGTVITMVISKAQVDAQGNPLKDANGRFIKGEVTGITVMEKRTGWGTEYPEELRNGEWEYSSFTPDGRFNDKANFKACFACHKPHAKQDFVISLAKLAGTFPSGPAMAKTGPADVNIAGFAFAPGTMTVPPGAPVTWTNTDDSPHMVVVSGQPLRTAVLLKGQSESLRFDAAGTFHYACGLHPNMKGTIEVRQ